MVTFMIKVEIIDKTFQIMFRTFFFGSDGEIDIKEDGVGKVGLH